MPDPEPEDKSLASYDMSVILVTGSYDRNIRFWEAWTGICSRTIERSSESGQVNRLTISPDKRFLAAAVYKKVHLYDVAGTSSTPIFVFEGHRSNVTTLSFIRAGKWLITGSEDGTIKLWDMRNASLFRSFDNGSPVNDICVHPNQVELISCDEAGVIKQWDLSKGLCTHELGAAGDPPVKSISLAADGSCLIAGNTKGKCYVWRINDRATGLPRFQAIATFQAHHGYITRILLSPDMRHLATCSADKTAKIWIITDNYDFRQRQVLRGHERWVWDCAFSADSAYILTASSDRTARLWDVVSGRTVFVYQGHSKAAVCCALHDGVI
ncbi:hypothetical protein PLICRDRAFT_39658 [Plicaturopsis crispa FD-325 SS-3]|nr:hypothetical protein PLICRDRAFT_39658 [Plicaturopsis crispa FD-325 SS-3]